MDGDCLINYLYPKTNVKENNGNLLLLPTERLLGLTRPLHTTSF